MKNQKVVSSQKSQQHQAGGPPSFDQRMNRIASQANIENEMNQSKDPVEHLSG